MVIRLAQTTTAVFAALFFLASCTVPIAYTAKDEFFVKQGAVSASWRMVAVLPFSGEPAYRRVCAEWFAFQLQKHQVFGLIAPAVADIKLRQEGIIVAEQEIGQESARESGRMLGAEAVLVGSIKIKPKVGLVAAVSLLDVESGKVVATSVHSESRRFGIRYPASVPFTVSEDVTEHVAEDIITVLYELVGRPSPPKTAPSQREEEMP